MPNYQTSITVNGHIHKTLKDILPQSSRQLDILFIAKTPAPKSVEKGHYFQGKQGKMFWNKLKEYKVLTVRPDTFEDENLLDNNYGLTDIVKVPRHFGDEPSNNEYKSGLTRVLDMVQMYKPKVIVFVYKKVLDNILRYGYGITQKSEYGFNKELESNLKAKVFVFPMPGTPCTTKQAQHAMTELQKFLRK